MHIRQKCLDDLMTTFLLRICLKTECFTKSPIPSTAPLLRLVEWDKLWGDNPLLNFVKNSYLFGKFAIELVAQ